MKSFIGDMDIETRCVCVRFNIDYYYYYYYYSHNSANSKLSNKTNLITNHIPFIPFWSAIGAVLPRSQDDHAGDLSPPFPFPPFPLPRLPLPSHIPLYLSFPPLLNPFPPSTPNPLEVVKSS